MTYLRKTAGRIGTPTQTEPLDDRQVKNSAGGYAYPVTDWVRLDRFLVLGTEGGTYYAGEQKLALENAKCISRCIKEDGERVVNRIVELSDAGRAYKNDPALFALAIAVSEGNDKTRGAAFTALPKVARIGTHLFHFAEYTNSMRGWGRGLRNAIGNWYKNRSIESLQNQLVKYQGRDGWSHRDLLRLAHPAFDLTRDGKQNAAIRWAVGGLDGMEKRAIKAKGTREASTYPDVRKYLDKLELIAAFETAKGYGIPSAYLEGKDKEEREKVIARHVKENEQAIADLIIEFELTREMIPTEFQNSKLVWEALFQKMPMTAMIRNLSNLTVAGLLTPMSATSTEVVKRLTDKKALKDARIHPLQALVALLAYKSGRSERRADKTWTPVQKVVDALDEAYYLAFGNIQPTGKRFYFGLDVSGSMGGGCIAGIQGMTPAMGSAAMAMVTARVEQNYHIMGFADCLRDLGISSKQRLDDVLRRVQMNNFGSTDCSLPMLDAAKNKIPVDVFVIITDNETWAGSIHPSQALQQYRQRMGIPAKEMVIGMTATNFSIADPNDAGMLDVAGFDTAVPQMLSSFALGNL